MKGKTWNLPEYTRLKHKLSGLVVEYVFDLCYNEWLLRTGRTYYNPNDFNFDEFQIISKEVV